ncbi:MAG: DUF6476 family protein [Gemmobacter sp.]
MREDSEGDAGPLPLSVRVLQWLVIAMTITMIVGVITVVAVVVTRMPRPAPYPALPDAVALPDGTRPEAITFGRGYVAVVTADGRIIILDRETGALRQTVTIEGAD